MKSVIGDELAKAAKDLTFKLEAMTREAFDRAWDAGANPLVVYLPEFHPPGIVQQPGGDQCTFRVSVKPSGTYARYTMSREEYMMLKAGNEPKHQSPNGTKPDEPCPDCGPEAQKAEIHDHHEPWRQGLTIGRIVHVCVRLPTTVQPMVERPAIITEVKCHERGIIAAHVFMSPDDPPGEIVIHEMGGKAVVERGLGDGGAGRPLGAELKYYDHPVQPKEPWTWHWPERTA